MGCESYQNRLMDAALGAPDPEGDAELREHLRVCRVCSAELERQRVLAAAMDRNLDALGTQELPLGFAARVRARVAEEESRGSAWLWRWWPAAAGALAVAMLVFWLAPRRTEGPPSLPPVVAVNPPPKVETPSVPQIRPAQGRALRILPHRGVVSVSRRTEPEVLVPAEEREGVRWLYSALRRQPQRMNALLAEQARYNEEKAKPLEIARLSIPPLEIGLLEPESRDSRVRQ